MFKDSNEFCIYLEEIKKEHNLDSYIDTIVWYSEHESDLEMEQLVKFLNKKIRDGVEYEARVMKLLKDNEPLVSLF